MKKFHYGTILLTAILSIMCGCQENSGNHNSDNEDYKEVKETMNPTVYIDPALDLSSDKTVSIIIQFKTKPAKIAVLEAEAKGIPLTLEEATKIVEESHVTFQKELQLLLDKNQVPYTVRHSYKTALNGVSMELPANEIKRLAENSTVISRIDLNKKIQLDPPISPFNQK